MDNFTDYDNDFDTAPAPVKAAAVPDGEYTAELVALQLGAADSGDKRIEWTFKITEGPKAGLRIWKNDYLPPVGSNEPKDVTKRGYIMADVKLVAGEIKFSEFLTRMTEFEGGTYELTVKTKGKYTNVYMNKRPTPAAPAAQPSLPGIPAPMNDGCPF